MACFFCMLIYFPHNLNLCSNSQETCFLRNVFEAVQKTRSTCFIGSKTTRLRLVVLNPTKHSYSFYKHYSNVMKNLISCFFIFAISSPKYKIHVHTASNSAPEPTIFQLLDLVLILASRCHFLYCVTSLGF